jgi:hypothetical protein
MAQVQIECLIAGEHIHYGCLEVTCCTSISSCFSVPKLPLTLTGVWWLAQLHPYDAHLARHVEFAVE